MIIDNLIVNSLVKEFSEKINDSKIQRIYQNQLNVFILETYNKGNTSKIVISLNPETYRVCITNNVYENKKISSPFLIQLKKYLESGKIISINQINYDRIIKFVIETVNDVRDKIELYLIVEITGKYSNLILTDTNNTVLGSFRYIDQEKNDERQIILDKPYVPITNKYNKLDLSKLNQEIFNDIFLKNQDKNIKKNLLNNFSYLSGNTCDYLIKKSNNNDGILDLNILFRNLEEFYKNLNSNNIYLEIENDSLFIEYGSKIPNICQKIENNFYATEKNKNISNIKNSLLRVASKFLNKVKDRIKSIDIFLNETNEELFKQYGDLIFSNLYYFPEKTKFIEVENYYDDNKIIKIELDDEKTLSENAQIFLKKYSKLKNTREAHNKNLNLLNFELSFLEDIIFNIESAESIDDLKDIEVELQEENYLVSKIKEKNKKKKELKKSDLLCFTYKDVDILVGKNNTQNEFLTNKYAAPNDIWLHARLIPGSHVIIRTENENKKISDDILLYAGKLAAKYSKAKYSSNVCVIYTKIKNIKKPPASKAGYVTYSNEKAIYVTPEI